MTNEEIDALEAHAESWMTYEMVGTVAELKRILKKMREENNRALGKKTP